VVEPKQVESVPTAQRLDKAIVATRALRKRRVQRSVCNISAPRDCITCPQPPQPPV